VAPGENLPSLKGLRLFRNPIEKVTEFDSLNKFRISGTDKTK